MKTIRIAGYCLALMVFTGTVWGNSLVKPLVEKESAVAIKKPAAIKGAPAETGMAETGPQVITVEELEDWLVLNKRATWRYFDQLDRDKQQQILLAYQRNLDVEALTNQVLRTYWQTRRR